MPIAEPSTTYGILDGSLEGRCLFMSLKEELMMDYHEMVNLKTALGFSPNTYAFYIQEFID